MGGRHLEAGQPRLCRVLQAPHPGCRATCFLSFLSPWADLDSAAAAVTGAPPVRPQTCLQQWLLPRGQRVSRGTQSALHVHTHTHTHTHTFVSLSLTLCCVAAVLPVDQRLTVKKIRRDPQLGQAPPPDGQELASTASSSSASRQRQRDGKSSRSRQSGKEQTADDEDDESWLSGMFRLRGRQRLQPRPVIRADAVSHDFKAMSDLKLWSSCPQLR
jgi:hypothetical protein